MKQITLLYNTEEIYMAEAEVKYIERYDNIDDFLKDSVYCYKITQTIPILSDILQQQISKHLGVQSCIIYETVLIASLATFLKLDKITKSSNDKNIRYIYTDGTNYLYQKGNPNGCDCELLYNKVSYNLEIKKPIARAGDGDVKVDGDGYIIGRKDFSQEINNWLHTINVLEHKKHNIPLQLNDAVRIVATYFNNIDNIMTTTVQGNNLVILKYNELTKYINFKGSEIRTTGKNWVKHKTLENYFLNYIVINGGEKIKDKIKIPNVLFEPKTRSRGKNTLSNWQKIDCFFRLKDKDILQKNDEYTICYLKDVEQTNPNVSAHINIIINEVNNDAII